MAMTAQQMEAELQRKAKLGIAPTSSANQGRYEQIKANITNQVKPQAPPSPTQPAPQPSQLSQGQSYVRNALEGAGMTDIGYDKGRNMVTSGGMDVIQPDKVVNGSSIASGDALKNAISKFREQDNQKKQQDLYTKLNELLGAAPQAKEFSYDAEADPVYQAALRRAQANATTATGNAMAEMNRRGLLSSTIMGDRAAQIQQGEFGRVSDEILPQLIQQAYGRHRDTYGDQYQQYRDQVGDTGNLLSTTNQMGQQAWENGMASKEANLNAALSVGEQTGNLVTPQEDWSGLFRQVSNGTNSQGNPLARNLSGQRIDEDTRRYDQEFTYTQGRDKVADKKWQDEFDHIKDQDGIENAIKWAQHNLDVQAEKRIAANQSSGGGSTAANAGQVITDLDMPRSVDSMITYIQKNLVGVDGNKLQGPANPNQLESIERLILSNPNLTDKQLTQLYQRFGIPLPQ